MTSPAATRPHSAAICLIGWMEITLTACMNSAIWLDFIKTSNWSNWIDALSPPAESNTCPSLQSWYKLLRDMKDPVRVSSSWFRSKKMVASYRYAPFIIIDWIISCLRCPFLIRILFPCGSIWLPGGCHYLFWLPFPCHRSLKGRGIKRSRSHVFRL